MKFKFIHFVTLAYLILPILKSRPDFAGNVPITHDHKPIVPFGKSRPMTLSKRYLGIYMSHSCKVRSTCKLHAKEYVRTSLWARLLFRLCKGLFQGVLLPIFTLFGLKSQESWWEV